MHYKTKVGKEIVDLIISGVSNVLIAGEESKHTKKILKRVYVDQRICKHIALLREHRTGTHSKHGQCEMFYIASFMVLFSHSNCSEQHVKE